MSDKYTFRPRVLTVMYSTVPQEKNDESQLLETFFTNSSDGKKKIKKVELLHWIGNTSLSLPECDVRHVVIDDKKPYLSTDNTDQSIAWYDFYFFFFLGPIPIKEASMGSFLAELKTNPDLAGKPKVCFFYTCVTECKFERPDKDTVGLTIAGHQPSSSDQDNEKIQKYINAFIHALTKDAMTAMITTQNLDRFVLSLTLKVPSAKLIDWETEIYDLKKMKV